MTKKQRVPDYLEMTPEQRSKVDALSQADIREIDENLLENASQEWSKLSRLVFATMIEREEGVTGLPEGFYMERVATLVKGGFLESRGESGNMKDSEVRLAEKN